MTLTTHAFSAFGAGILASLSPCVYPMIPITIGYLGTQTKSKKPSRVLFFGLGQMLALIAIGMLAVAAGETFGFTSQMPNVQIGMGLLLIGAGWFSYHGRLPTFLNRFNNARLPIAKKWLPAPVIALLVGFGSALVMSPCTTPILSGVLAVIATSATLSTGIALMTAYSLGFTLLVLVVGFGLLKWTSMPRAGNWLKWTHGIGTAALVIAGCYFIYQGLTML